MGPSQFTAGMNHPYHLILTCRSLYMFEAVVSIFSDGMGRTGTFCALMMCHDRLKTEHMADVFNAIKTIRTHRPGMVGNPVSIM